MIPRKFKKYITESELTEVENIVAIGENKTSAEIVPVVVLSSVPKDTAFIVISALFVMVGLLTRSPLWLLLIPTFYLINRSFANKMVQTRAETEFFINKLKHTQNATGVLVFMSLKEKRIVVLADSAISQFISPNDLNKIVDSGLEVMKNKGRISDALSIVISQVVELVTPLAPYVDGTNELPNHVILKD